MEFGIIKPALGGHVGRCGLRSLGLLRQNSTAVHVESDTLNVVGNVSRLLDGFDQPRPLELRDDGDCFTHSPSMYGREGPESVKLTNVKGHADDETVRLSVVRALDKDGSDRADAADLRRRRVDGHVLDAGRVFSKACQHWYTMLARIASVLHCCGSYCV